MVFFDNLKEFKNHFFKKENIYFLVIAISIFFFDRLTKNKVINNFSENTFYINDYINVDLIWNVGIGFGLLSTSSSELYNLVTLIIGLIISFLFYIFIISNKKDKFIYSLILGGAIGNFYDRLTYKAVPDFVDLHFDNFHWFTFNVADVFITIGILIFIINSFFEKI